MKNYSNISETYIRGAGLKKVYIRDQTGVFRLSLKTDKEIAELRRKGVAFTDSKP